jgi:hypothetical protein
MKLRSVSGFNRAKDAGRIEAVSEPRVGQPDWKGEESDKSRESYFPFRLRISGGYKSSVRTFRMEAKSESSLSLTERSRASICESVPRLISKPPNWHRAANCSWVSCNLFRSSLICGPTTLAGFLVWAMLEFELDLILKTPLDC